MSSQEPARDRVRRQAEQLVPRCQHATGARRYSAAPIRACRHLRLQPGGICSPEIRLGTWGFRSDQRLPAILNGPEESTSHAGIPTYLFGRPARRHGNHQSGPVRPHRTPLRPWPRPRPRASAAHTGARVCAHRTDTLQFSSTPDDGRPWQSQCRLGTHRSKLGGQGSIGHSAAYAPVEKEICDLQDQSCQGDVETWQCITGIAASGNGNREE